ncbi:unnamed protein product [Adineta steineri]|uniref:Uncharacterized protein n=1 Tax=Adineta steineri TaxID=433720 RepID=A0A813M312_9BILA|nr:unnamed protein product [Adineta steineri]CAF3501556.1 unnamed protein product [Adineta steineri]
MQRVLLFKLIIILVILTFSPNVQGSSCTPNGVTLQCSLTGPSTINTNSIPTGINSLNITYSGSTSLSIMAPSTVTLIQMNPVDTNDNHTLQISNINTGTARIEINIRLSINQVSLTLFTPTCSILASNSTIRIHVIQTISDAANFKIFDSSNTGTMNFGTYEVIFDQNNSNSGTLNFPNLICGLKNISSIIISGNKHYLNVQQSQMASPISIYRLALKNLRLYNQVLYNVNNLHEYLIEGCDYNKTAQFLNSNQDNNISLIMKNNNPLDLTLPNGENAFVVANVRFISITLNEPKLNSSCLNTIKGSKLNLITLVLNLGSYSADDFEDWKEENPYFWYLTIMNISTLDIFPSKFFNSLDALVQTTLQGTFSLEKNHICIFAGFPIPARPVSPLLTLSSSENPGDWDRCADTYIKAINQRSIENVQCPNENTCQDCANWSQYSQQCNFTKLENQCEDNTRTTNNPFYYSNSYLYSFFQNCSWLDRPTCSAVTPSSQPNSMNIGAIIGAVCGLIVAIAILGITIFYIYQSRRKQAAKNLESTSKEKPGHSAYDSTNVSVATSKTSQSSRYALQHSFFPPIQPNDEIAPPLYTAPSESIAPTSPYNFPPVPSAPRDSISTHATHVYETVDNYK